MDFIWTNGRDVWCQFSFWFRLLSQLGELTVAPQSQVLFESRTWVVEMRSLETLLLIQACVYMKRLYVTQPGLQTWSLDTQTQPAVLLSVRPPCLLSCHAWTYLLLGQLLQPWILKVQVWWCSVSVVIHSKNLWTVKDSACLIQTSLYNATSTTSKGQNDCGCSEGLSEYVETIII